MFGDLAFTTCSGRSRIPRAPLASWFRSKRSDQTRAFEFRHGRVAFGSPRVIGRAIGAITDASCGGPPGPRHRRDVRPAWSGRTVEDDPRAPFFNETQKFIVSSTLTCADEWQNSTVLGAYDPQVIEKLKEEVGGIYISRSDPLVRTLLADSHVDELT
jgi:hypothetical protein